MGIPTQFSDLYLNKSGPRSPAGLQLGVASCWRERDATVTKVPTSHESGPFSPFFPAHTVSECLLAGVERLRASYYRMPASRKRRWDDPVLRKQRARLSA